MGTPIPHNRAPFTVEELVRATGGALVAHADTSEEPAIGISTDTRVLERGAAFVALRGETFDGHAHLDAAAAAGARLAIVEREVEAPGGLAILRVASTLDALGALAAVHMRRWRALGRERKAVAITGSAGKTTTRVALASLCERLRPGEVHATYGNLNNRIGAPMVLLGLEPRHRLAVIEVGTNQPGEIAALARIIEADAAVLTLIAAAHVEGLGSLDGVAREKGALLEALGPEGYAIHNQDDARVRDAARRVAPSRRVGYGFGDGADYRITRREPDGLRRSRIRVERAAGALAFATPLLGEAGALASVAAIAVVERALGLHVDGDVVTEALSAADVGAGAGRLVPRLCADGLALIDDSYNANPASCCASIRASAELAAASGRRLVLVLGEMRELGPECDRGHDEVGAVAAASGASEIFAVAGAARRIALAATAAGKRAVFAETVAEATALVLGAVHSGDLVLVKGSRGVATERVISALSEAHDEAVVEGARG